jgi:hypothetical protein
LNYVLRELADIQVERDQIVDLMHFSGSQLGLDGAIALMAVDGFTPNLGGESKLFWRFRFQPVRCCTSATPASISAGSAIGALLFIAS